MLYINKQKHNNYLKRQATKCNGFFGVFYNDKKKRYVRYYRGKYSKYLKQVGSRKFRRQLRQGVEYGNGNSYKKSFDFWWELI